jgi:hypothetical protein
MRQSEINAAKTHCPQGHEYTPENTYLQPKGSRACRVCLRESNRRQAAKRRAERPPKRVPCWEDFVEKTDGGCWLWRGAINPKGYGKWPRPDGSRLAHRRVYELVVGPIPAGLQLDHLCRVRACVNPAHLEPVTNRENARRGEGWAGLNAQKTHCPQGHPYAGENLYVNPGGGRRCRECDRVKRQRYRDRFC